MTTVRKLVETARGSLFGQVSPLSVRESLKYSTSNRRIIRENDIVLLKQKGNDRTNSVLSKPLRPGDKIQIERASIAAGDVIGTAVRDLVRTSKGIEYRIQEPSIGEYTDLSPRLVTPIYAQDANLIVSLLDLHPSTPGAENGGGQDRIEIFEAGTGHGALTLNLARAIHGANSAAPPKPDPTSKSTPDDATNTANHGPEADEYEKSYDAWRANRRAVIHTLDHSAVYSRHAENTVRNFRQGMYYPNVDFHVGSIDKYLAGRLSKTNESFLDHAILDLPGTHEYLEIVAEALKANGSLVTWCPSITQINKCVMLVKEKKMPFLLEKVIEVGVGLSGGRPWDVRMVRPRALMKTKLEVKAPNPDDDVEDPVAENEEDSDSLAAPTTQVEGWEMVCRPKVGVRVVGGGFVALWRKMDR